MLIVPLSTVALVILTFCTAMPAAGQRLSFGLIAGGYPTRGFEERKGMVTIDFGQGPTQPPTAILSRRGGYMVGLQAEVGLTRALSFSFGGV